MSEALKLDLQVTDAMWVGLFDRLEIWRSMQGSSGPYSELTGPAWAPASFSFLARPYVVTGRVLSLLVQEVTQVDVTFTTSDPLSAAAVASQIQAQSSTLLQASVVGTQVVVSTSTAGAIAVVRVLSSDGAGIFGLPTDDAENAFYGQDARIILTQGVLQYSFVDPYGSTDYYYKIRFLNSLNNTVGEFSPPFQVQDGASIGSSNLITGTIDLFDIDGSSLRNTLVLLSGVFSPALINGSFIAGAFKSQLTDANGHASFTLVRGSKVSVSVAGTNLARTITVPTDPTLTTFNLLDPSIADPDLFAVQIPSYQWATKRSL